MPGQLIDGAVGGKEPAMLGEKGDANASLP